MTAQAKKWTIAAIVLAAIVIGFGAYYFYIQHKLEQVSQLPSPKQVSASKHAGIYNDALEKYRAVLNDPNASVEAKAVATYLKSGVEFHITGNIDARVQDVRDLQGVVTNQGVSTSTRATAAYVLAGAFGDSGTDPTVLAEMFKQQPFAAFYIPNSPGLSVRKIYEFSYGLMPTPEAAIHVAKWYADAHVLRSARSASSTAADLQSAQDYLMKADQAAALRGRSEPNYLGSARYFVQFQFWRSVVVGRLAQAGIAPYTTEYRNEFGRYISFAQQSNDPQALENLYYARFYYAQALISDKDTVTAKGQLDQLAKELNARSDPQTSSFIRLVLNSLKNGDANSKIIAQLETISPDFRAAVDKLSGRAAQ